MSKLSAILMVLILSGCATAYQPTGFSGGFSEIQLADNVWQVSFEGNGYTKDKRARDLALLRSADLTLQQGYTHFLIADSANSHELSTFTMPATSYTTGSIYGSGRYAYGNATTTTYGGGTSLIKKPETTNVVHMFRGKPDVPFMVYEAAFICTSFGQKYDVTCGVTK